MGGLPDIVPLLVTTIAVPSVPLIGPVEPVLLIMQSGPALPSGQVLENCCAKTLLAPSASTLTPIPRPTRIGERLEIRPIMKSPC
jgi:hypothetical protein